MLSISILDYARVYHTFMLAYWLTWGIVPTQGRVCGAIRWPCLDCRRETRSTITEAYQIVRLNACVRAAVRLSQPFSIYIILYLIGLWFLGRRSLHRLYCIWWPRKSLPIVAYILPHTPKCLVYEPTNSRLDLVGQANHWPQASGKTLGCKVVAAGYIILFSYGAEMEACISFVRDASSTTSY